MMTGAIPPKLLRNLLPPEAADAFLRLLWGDIVNQRVGVQTENQQKVIRKSTIEIDGRNYPPLLALHWGLTSAVADQASADLLPAFAFFRLYFGGDICLVHADLPVCEFSLSLTLGYSDNQPWALSVGTEPAEDLTGMSEDFEGAPYKTFLMQAGDGLLYAGNRFRHGRPTPNPNRWSAHLFLQWVTRDGPHIHRAFDRVELPGRPVP